MSDKPISPLRQRMIDDMTARRFSERVQKAYVRHVRTFAAFLGRSPDTATSEDLRRFQLHMAQQEISSGALSTSRGSSPQSPSAHPAGNRLGSATKLSMKANASNIVPLSAPARRIS